MFELSVRDDFGAAHRIIGYPGKCNNLHGHNWVVEAVVCGSKLNELGMLIDFKKLKGALKEIIGELDHHYLNELEPFSTANPSAENIAAYLYHKLSQHENIKGKCHVKFVKVWETEKSAVSYCEEA
ncbi:6-carboxytetrahydropterin synthase QueD [Pectinatus cerevisiiphilus]|uniref:6-carboxy-5,6,7,8-tetrahydropterin synthase n=1 Tax=Pectinatus cerevisiiphilus TaxID=86956 RepID=A0A4R3KCP4_9FIRM|nr:6-carboxytetrahydropterin synthase QueD [Pectinatus cerevisiiphilus]TCS80411.1 6-pyruvoyltetrahydropterin/6-carboxytetrahydropterin synthase [Pectinatus cerevisiiphilus]